MFLKLIKISVKTIAFFLVTFALLELCSMAYLNLQKDNSSHKEAYKKELINRYQWNQPRVSHPYFGFVYQQNKSVNNMGFHDSHNFPLKKKKNDFVVGVFGGSIALMLAPDLKKSIPRVLKEKHPKLKNKNIIVLNYALGMSKQPQQFYIASYFMSNLDLMINVDGFNELTMPVSKYFPSDFPPDSQYYLLNYNKHIASLYKAKKLNDLRIELAKLPTNWSILAESKAYYLFFSSSMKLISYYSKIYFNKYGVDIEKDKKGFVSKDKESGDKFNIEGKLKNWKKYIYYQSSLAKVNNVPSYFFIQPNQYVKDSKKFSEQELKTAFNGSKNHITIWYKKLAKSLKALRNSGVNIYDLSDIFKSTKETVYIDTCCHVNAAGNKILVNEISNLINKSN